MYELVKSKSKSLENPFGRPTEMFGTRFIVLFALAGLCWLFLSDARRLANVGDKRGHGHFSLDARTNERLPEISERGWFCNDYRWECLDENGKELKSICIHYWFDPKTFGCSRAESDSFIFDYCKKVNNLTKSIRATGFKCDTRY